VSPEDVILIFPEIPNSVIPGEEYEIKIKLKNRGNIALTNYEVLLSSDLPQLHKNFVTDFEPKEEIVEIIKFTVPEQTKAGDYVVNIKVYDIDSKTVRVISCCARAVPSERG